MTAATTGVPASAAGSAIEGAHVRLTFARIVRSEWLKLRTLRSTWFALAGAVIVLVLAAGLIGNHVHDRLLHPGFLQDPEEHDVLTTPLRGFGLTQLVIGVLGVLTVSGEYSTGMIRATFSAVPKRLPVLWAKLIVFAAVGFTTMLVASLAAFFTAQRILGGFGVSLSSPNALRVVVALAGYLALIGLLGLALGFIVRSTAGGIAALVAVVLVLPGILAALGTSWATTTAHYLPLSAGLAMISDRPPAGGELGPGAGAAVMACWVALSVIVAAVLIRSRDA